MSPEIKSQVNSPDSIGASDHPDTTSEPHLPESRPPADNQAAAPVVVLKPEITSAPAKGKAATSDPGRPQVHLAPHLLDLVTGRSVTPADRQAAKEQRDLNEIVHQMLVIGLILSTTLMLVGLGLDLILGREVPTAVPDFGDIFNRVVALRPSGFLALGLLVLIATPILRVVGSIFAFLYERDWRYAGITTFVLGIVMVSLAMGKA